VDTTIMGSAPSAPLPLARLAGVGAVVFLANAALLVLQLVASKLLAPFIGSDLYTWTSIIGVFLTGIALGNAFGGRLADRYPSPWMVVVLLAAGALAAVWMVVFAGLMTSTAAYHAIPLGPRIPLLCAVLCLPAGLVLSLLTPLSIKLGLPDVSQTGRVAGMVFALSTLGCLLGNYVTGFYLIPDFRINTLVFVAAAALLATAAGVFVVLKLSPPAGEQANPWPQQTEAQPDAAPPATNPFAFADIRRVYLIVFLASFCGMTLELTASRVIARQLGVSLFSWTGVIGVMLAGTALGNLTGGILADRANRPGGMRRAAAWLLMVGGGLYTFALVYKGLAPLLARFGQAGLLGADNSTALLVLAVVIGGGTAVALYLGTVRMTDDEVTPRTVLAGTLIAGGVVTILIFVSMAVVTHSEALHDAGLIGQVMGWSFALFFLPMFVLGMVSPQMIRLAVPDVARAGRVAGRVYAWSTVGAIAGTFAAGYALISTLGIDRTIIAAALVLMCLSLLCVEVWRHNVLLYVFSIGMGGITGGLILTWNPLGTTPRTVYMADTNYYTIKVNQDEQDPGLLNLYLDLLLHSTVNVNDPTYIYYHHEHIQMEFLRAARAQDPHPKVLVIGGGGYTFPRYAKALIPETEMDVVEIDPGVTRAAYEHLGLKREYGIRDHNMDGRQFVAERAVPGSYDLVVQDAVNDLSVPAHLLTKEYNDAVKRALKPGGVYLLTIIDEIDHGKLWRASMATLRLTFPHVALLSPNELMGGAPPPGANEKEAQEWEWWQENWAQSRQVYVIYASDRPLDVAELREQNDRAAGYLPAAAAVAGGYAAAKAPPPFYLRVVPDASLAPYLRAEPGVILTDQYAPVDNLMADVFRRRRQE
jgi:hypothetical protein